MTPWLPVIVTVALGVIGLAIQGALLAYFIGRMKEHQAGQEKLVGVFQSFTEAAITGLTSRLGVLDEIAAESKADRATLNAKMTQVERNTEGLGGLREALAAYRATFEATRDRQKDDLDRLNRGVESVQRQLAQIASRGGGGIVPMDRQVERPDG